MKKRAQHVIGVATAIFLLGLGYASWIWNTGIAIPCFFHKITGLQCPGCGVTRMCLALLQLDFVGAWRANAGLFLLSPLLIWALWNAAIQYIKRGRFCLNPKGERLVFVAVVYLVVWGLLRNFLL